MTAGIMLGTSLALIILHLLGRSHALEITSCRSAIGMQSGEIPDEYITASSSFDSINVGPLSSRIRTEINGGAWCPKDQVSPSVHEYLQIDMGSLKVVTLVETQGRFGNGQGQEYMEQYKLEYQREEFGPWFKFRNRRGQEIFQGNSNTYIAELREVDPPIVARRIRIVPYSPHAKHICMRAEVYGCDWKDGVVSYNMPQGDRRSADLDLSDSTYDGLSKDNFLAGGLGQLMDGDEGQSNFRLDPRSLGVRGYEWVGWKNDSSPGWIEVTFVFDAVRNFTGLRIHCNNMFSKDVRVFHMARVYFSVGGSIYAQEPIEYVYIKDSLIEYARTVYIHLNHRVGRYVKVQLFFESRWLMISEIQFESDYAVGLILSETLQQQQQPHHNNKALLTLDNIGSSHNNSMTLHSDDSLPKGSTGQSLNGDQFIQSIQPVGGSPPPGVDPAILIRGQGFNDEYVGIVVGAVVTFFLVSFALLVLFLWRRRGRGQYTGRHRVMKCSGEGNGSLCGVPGQGDSMEHNGSGKARHQGYRKTGGVASKLLFGRFKGDSTPEPPGPDTASNMYNFFTPGTAGGGSSDLDSDQACCGGVSNATIEFSFFRDPAGPLGANNGAGGRRGEPRRLPELPPTSHTSDTYTSKDYPNTTNQGKMPIIAHSPPINSLTLQHAPPPYRFDQSATSRRQPSHHSSTLRHPSGYHRSVNQLQGAGFTSASSALLDREIDPGFSTTLEQENSEVSVLEFPGEKLNFTRVLGKGKFSEVRLCEARGIDDESINQSSSSSLIVMAARIITCSLSNIDRENLEEDIRLMARLRDQNILRLLAASSCTAASSSPSSCRCLLVEYMRYGSLGEYLARHVQEHTVTGRDTSASNAPVLGYSAQIYIMAQIASGMKYLESRNLVHRHLNANACLVSDLHAVKISNNFLLKQTFWTATDLEDHAVRWMAWESAVLAQFSMKSDVWSFGMTMWEVLTLSKTAPLEDRLPTLAHVHDNFQHYYQSTGAEICPDQPVHCAREIYDLMRECWNRDEGARPAFREIHMFLKRKNMGYDPREDWDANINATSVATRDNDTPAVSTANATSLSEKGLYAVNNVNPVIV